MILLKNGEWDGNFHFYTINLCLVEILQNAHTAFVMFLKNQN